MKCMSGITPTLEPTLHVWAKAQKKEDRTAKSAANLVLKGALLCTDCVKDVDAQRFISDEGWKTICDSFAKINLSEPDREGVLVSFDKPLVF